MFGRMLGKIFCWFDSHDLDEGVLVHGEYYSELGECFSLHYCKRCGIGPFRI